MADTYGVTADNVAAELQSLFPNGFTTVSNPPDTLVTSWIAAHDVVVTLVVQRAAAVVPAATDQAAPLAKRYIIAAVEAQVVRAVYAGNDPERVAAAAKAYQDQADFLLEEIRKLGSQMTGTGQVSNRVRVPDMTAPRDLLVTDDVLGPNATLQRARRKMF